MSMFFARRFEDLFIRDELVDDAAHAFGGGFGREREARAAAVAQFVHQIHRDGFDAQGRERDDQLLALEGLADGADQFADVGVIGRRKRHERQFLEAGGLDGRFGRGDHDAEHRELR